MTEVLSGDCGIKSTSWAHLFVSKNGNVDLRSIGTIDFLDGQPVADVPMNEWPGRIHAGLKKHAPKVSKKAIVAIEIQHQRHRGKISSANAATQYSIGMWYHSNPIVFVNATHKNEVGYLTMEAVSILTGKDVSDCRKKHSRMNFELYWIGREGSLPGTKKGWKIRDVADAFMQGIYIAKMVWCGTLGEAGGYSKPRLS